MLAASIAGERSAPKNKFRVMTVIFGPPLRFVAASAAAGRASATSTTRASMSFR
jgi:hypothetical protein